VRHESSQVTQWYPFYFQLSLEFAENNVKQCGTRAMQTKLFNLDHLGGFPQALGSSGGRTEQQMLSVLRSASFDWQQLFVTVLGEAKSAKVFRCSCIDVYSSNGPIGVVVSRVRCSNVEVVVLLLD